MFIGDLHPQLVQTSSMSFSEIVVKTLNDVKSPLALNGSDFPRNSGSIEIIQKFSVSYVNFS